MSISDAERIKALEDELAGVRFAAKQHLTTVNLQTKLLARSTEQAPIQSAGAADEPSGYIATAMIGSEYTAVAFKDIRTARAMRIKGEITPFWTAALAVPATAPTVQAHGDESALRDAVAESLRGNYYCGRVWSAWSVGTMREDDFSPSEEVDESIDQVMDAIRPFLPQPTPPAAPSLTDAAFLDWLDGEDFVALNCYVQVYGDDGLPLSEERKFFVVERESDGAAVEGPTVREAIKAAMDRLSGEPARKEGE